MSRCRPIPALLQTPTELTNLKVVRMANQDLSLVKAEIPEPTLGPEQEWKPSKPRDQAHRTHQKENI